ncbi:triose-phosphate isomerase [Candidatus Kaiserbacteria bacterium]|nr:MAG: triose-phosphate isomerase [Candidatus Kaiserbacteria bacterium]
MKSVICNWKMNPATFAEAKKLFDATKTLAASVKKVDIVVAPPVVFLRELAKGYRGTRVEFGAQNISTESEGSHTGETAAAQVRDAGATHVIIGHAERRALGETDEQVGKKVLTALENKMDAIIAVGESERDIHGEYVQVVRNQIVTALREIPAARFKNVTIAYEPIWAIGAPTAPDANEVHQMMLLVRKTVRDAFGDKALKAVRVVYGGAVNEDNAEGILRVPDLDGVLVGRASLDPARLKVIVQAAQSA